MPTLTTVVPNFEGTPILTTSAENITPYQPEYLAEAIALIAYDLRTHYDYLQAFLTEASTNNATSVQVFATPSLPVCSPWQAA